MTRSLESRLLLGMTLGMLSTLLVSGLAFYWLMRSALVGEFDASLASQMRTLAALVTREDRGIHSDMADGEIPAFERVHQPQYYQLWNQNGSVLERSRHLRTSDLPRLSGSLDRPSFQSLVLPDGRPGRAAGVRFVPLVEAEDDKDDSTRDSERTDDEQPAAEREVAGTAATAVTLVVARDTLDLSQTLQRVRWTLLIVLCGATCGLGLIIAPIARVGLRPLQETSDQIQMLQTHNLATRLDTSRLPTELKQLVGCLNDLLQRLEEGVQRERRFSAHVAHELRTPLAGLRSTIEVTLTQPRDDDTYRTALSRCLEICTQTQTIVENLLSLARIDEGRYKFSRETLQLGVLLQSVWNPFIERARGKELQVLCEVLPNAELQSDPHVLRLILHNLFDNAVSHSDKGGFVRVAANGDEDRTVLTISNSGCRLPPSDAEFLFDRFWRGEKSRHQTGTHAGLGLAMCKEFSHLLSHELEASISDDGVFTVRLIFS